MALERDRTHSMSYESTSFRTKEGTYRKNSFRYCRETKKAHSGKELSSVAVSFVSCKDKDGSNDWITFNSAREYYFYPFHGVRKFPDLAKPLDKRSYRAPTIPVCHDFNLLTRSTDRLDLVIGFSTGPLQHVNPISRKSQAAFNEDCSIDKTRVTCVKWVPGSENQFVSSHRSGNLYVWTTAASGKATGPIQFLPHSEIQDAVISTVKSKHKSPLMYRWSIGHGAINGFAFSPDLEHIAIASQDGFMRIYHFKTQEFHSRMRSYFGGITCICWSPDGCYVVTGGEDDLVTVWSFYHRRVVARGEGHQSYISAIAFDPYTTVLPESLSDLPTSPLDLDDTVMGRPPSIRGRNSFRLSSAIDTSSLASSPYLGRLASEAGGGKEVVAYRLGSVGQDSHLCLWDLSEDALKIRRPFARSRSRPSRMMSSHPTESVKQKGTGIDETGGGGGGGTREMGEDFGSRARSDALDQVSLHKTLSSAHSQDEDSTTSSHSNTNRSHSITNDAHSTDQCTTVTTQTSRRHSTAGEEGRRKSASGHRKLNEKETTPAASSVKSDPGVSAGKPSPTRSAENGSKNGKKNKSKVPKESKEGKKGNARGAGGQQKGIREPMKRVMKFVGIGGQHHNHRREVSAFDACKSDDIAPKMDEVNVIEPLVAERVDHERLSDLVFREDCIVVASYDGNISLWARPGVESRGEDGGTTEGGTAPTEEGAPPSELPTEAATSDKPPETHPGLNSPRPGGGPNSPLKQTTV